jgi:hypothetical protein
MLDPGPGLALDPGTGSPRPLRAGASQVRYARQGFGLWICRKLLMRLTVEPPPPKAR